MSNKILIIDIETTGFIDKGGKIVEIGIVELNLDNGEKSILFDEVCHEKNFKVEDVPDSWIFKNSDMTVEDVKYSRSLDLMSNEIQSIIDEYPLGVTAFNNAFDFGFMENRGFHFPSKLPCPMKLSTYIVKIKSKYKWQGQYKWPSVQEAYNFFFGKTEYIEKHRGADDAFYEADIVYELYKRGVFKLN